MVCEEITGDNVMFGNLGHGWKWVTSVLLTPRSHKVTLQMAWVHLSCREVPLIKRRPGTISRYRKTKRSEGIVGEQLNDLENFKLKSLHSEKPGGDFRVT